MTLTLSVEMAVGLRDLRDCVFRSATRGQERRENPSPRVLSSGATGVCLLSHLPRISSFLHREGRCSLPQWKSNIPALCNLAYGSANRPCSLSVGPWSPFCTTGVRERCSQGLSSQYVFIVETCAQFQPPWAVDFLNRIRGTLEYMVRDITKVVDHRWVVRLSQRQLQGCYCRQILQECPCYTLLLVAAALLSCVTMGLRT